MDRDVDEVDYFRDPDLIGDPYPYLDEMRSRCPVRREPHHGVVVVTGYEEGAAAFADTTTLSSCIAPNGPFPGFQTSFEGHEDEDITDLIAEHRHEVPLNKEIFTLDPPDHTKHRSLMMRQFTPKRVGETVDAMRGLADAEIDTFIDNGCCEFVGEFAAPYALMNICSLMGVPDEDRDEFRVEMLGEHRTRQLGVVTEKKDLDPFAFMHDRITRYITERRAEPRDDVLTRMAEAPFPDGSTPEVVDVVRLASALFIGGSGTTSHLLGCSLVRLAEDQALQDRLRSQPELVPNFVEEMLRLEGPVKATFRMSRVPTSIGGEEIPSGTTVMLSNAGMGRDPREYDNPNELDVERENARHHLAFGFGAHVCPGAALARAEAKVAIERLLERVHDIRIDESVHGPAGDRKFSYEPSYQLHGLTSLNLTFTPA